MQACWRKKPLTFTPLSVAATLFLPNRRRLPWYLPGPALGDTGFSGRPASGRGGPYIGGGGLVTVRSRVAWLSWR